MSTRYARVVVAVEFVYRVPIDDDEVLDGDVTPYVAELVDAGLLDELGTVVEVNAGPDVVEARLEAVGR